MMTVSRRSFLRQSIQAASVVGVVYRPSRSQADEPATAAELAGKAVDFLRPRQGADGSWSGDRRSPASRRWS